MMLVVGFLASCSGSEPVTARPDPNAASSGTLGSVKATDGTVLHQDEPDTAAARPKNIKK